MTIAWDEGLKPDPIPQRGLESAAFPKHNLDLEFDHAQGEHVRPGSARLKELGIPRDNDETD
ncbi:hypothetical protein NIIDMKKI_18190 [Mycobacterium kansasii]|uniref:Uncharacterized protein n=1 Tax=Mycobacterium kansasii TaxID=1768 RepID=A0A7G1I8I5_MYCKA|nr:hypothetical protein NIIDMKKI_18190 [Mycobacterium kansasii]